MEPIVKTRQGGVQEYAEHYRRELAKGWNPPTIQGYDRKVRAIAALPDPVDPDAYAAILGEPVGVQCHGCGDLVDRAVLVGQETGDFEDAQCVLCLRCVCAALDALQSKEGR